jgi:hypothetical protein
MFVIFLYLFKPLESFPEHTKMLTYEIGIGMIQMLIFGFAVNDDSKILG